MLSAREPRGYTPVKRILFPKIGRGRPKVPIYPYVHAFQKISLYLEKMRLFRNHLFSGVLDHLVTPFPKFSSRQLFIYFRNSRHHPLAHSILPECRISSQFRSHSHRAAMRRDATISCSWSAVDIAQLFMSRL